MSNNRIVISLLVIFIGILLLSVFIHTGNDEAMSIMKNAKLTSILMDEKMSPVKQLDKIVELKLKRSHPITQIINNYNTGKNNYKTNTKSATTAMNEIKNLEMSDPRKAVKK